MSSTYTRSFMQDFKLSMKGLRALWHIEKSAIPMSLFHAIVAGLQPFVAIYFSAQIINELVGGRSPDRIWQLVIWTIVSVFLVAVLEQGLVEVRETIRHRAYFKEMISVNAAAMYTDYENLESASFQKLNQDYYEAFRTRAEALLLQLLTQVEAFTKGITAIVAAMFFSCSLFLPHPSSMPMLHFLNSPFMTLLLFALILFTAYGTYRVSQKKGRVLPKLMAECIANQRLFRFCAKHAIYEYQQGKEVRIFAEQPLFHSIAKHGVDERAKPVEEYGKVEGSCDGCAAVLTNLLSGAVYLFVALKALAGMFAVGSVVQYAGAISQFAAGFSDAAVALATIRTSSNDYLHFYFDVVDTPRNKQYGGELPKEGTHTITFCDVSFRYPGSEQDVLHKLNITIGSGRRLAVVGQNGSGKTTMIKLLCRLYDPTAGQILLDGINIKDYPEEVYSHLFSVVFQDFQLFSSTIGENIASSMAVEKERAVDCLQKAGFNCKESVFSKGVDTVIYKHFDESGVEISGGEAQKIAMARALYKDAPFVVLDEPTAALDPIAEHEIYTRFNEMIGEKCAVYISHRLSSCRFCHDIAVFDAGNLVQFGSHDQLLLEKEGKYYQLWHAQAQYYS